MASTVPNCVEHLEIAKTPSISSDSKNYEKSVIISGCAKSKPRYLASHIRPRFERHFPLVTIEFQPIKPIKLTVTGMIAMNAGVDSDSEYFRDVNFKAVTHRF
jgi:hypothetical protein